MSTYTPDFTQEDCAVTHRDGTTYLNYRLAVRQQLDKKAVHALVATHQKKDEIFAEMKECTDKALLKEYAAEVTKLYYEQQRLWKFPEDPNFHQFWEMPGCKCPFWDNRERLGTSFKVHASDCPIHGD